MVYNLKGGVKVIPFITELTGRKGSAVDPSPVLRRFPGTRPRERHASSAVDVKANRGMIAFWWYVLCLYGIFDQLSCEAREGR